MQRLQLDPMELEVAPAIATRKRGHQSRSHAAAPAAGGFAELEYSE
jgi:hypothetical protein